MSIRKLSLFLVLLIILSIAGSVSAQAQEGDSTSQLEALRAALKEERYLDAYDQYVILNDSAPSALIEGLNPQVDSETNQQVRIFLFIFSGQTQQAVEEVKTLPESTFTLVVQAAADELMGNAKDATDAFPVALDHVTDKAQFYGLMAAVAFTTGNPEKVLDNSSKAIELAPDLAPAYRLRGIGKLFTGNPEAALKDADQAIQLDPTTYFFHYLRGNVHFALGDPEAALKDVDVALAINDHSVIGYAMRSKANMALNNMEDAARDFAKSIEARTNRVIEGEPLSMSKSVQIAMTFGTTFHMPFKAQAGQSLDISVISVQSGVVDPNILLLSPNGTPLAFNDDASEDTLDAAINKYTLPESGTYTLVVSHANGGSEGQLEVLISPA